MSGLQYPSQQYLSCLTGFYPSFNDDVRYRLALAQKVSDGASSRDYCKNPLDTIKFTYSPYSGYQADGFVLAVTGKVAKVPALSPTHSFTVPVARDAPALELSSPPCNMAAEPSGAEDVVTRAPAAAVIPSADELLGGSPPAASCQTDAAAYRSETQLLAWARGQFVTWAAAAQQQAQQRFVVKPAGPIILEEKGNFKFSCLEATARIGKRATYAMAAAGAR